MFTQDCIFPCSSVFFAVVNPFEIFWEGCGRTRPRPSRSRLPKRTLNFGWLMESVRHFDEWSRACIFLDIYRYIIKPSPIMFLVFLGPRGSRQNRGESLHNWLTTWFVPFPIVCPYQSALRWQPYTQLHSPGINKLIAGLQFACGTNNKEPIVVGRMSRFNMEPA